MIWQKEMVISYYITDPMMAITPSMFNNRAHRLKFWGSLSRCEQNLTCRHIQLHIAPIETTYILY